MWSEVPFQKLDTERLKFFRLTCYTQIQLSIEMDKTISAFAQKGNNLANVFQAIRFGREQVGENA